MDEHDAGTPFRLDRRTALRLGGSAVALALAGCTAPRTPRITNRVPASAAFLVGVEGAVADDPETEQVLDLLTGDGPPPTDGFQEQTGLDFDRVSELVLFGTSSPEGLAPAEADGTVVDGDFGEEEVVAGFEASRGISFTETEYRGRTLYLLRPGEGETEAFTHHGRGTFVFGTRSTVEATLDVRVGDAESVGGQLLAAYEGVRDDALIRFGIDVPERPPEQLPEGTVDPLETLAGGYYTPADGVGLTLTGDAVSPEAARDVETQITTLLAALASGGGPLTEALVNVQVERDGETIQVTYESTLAAFEALVAAIREGQGPSPVPVPGDDVTNERTGRSFGAIQAAVDDAETQDGDVILVADRDQPYVESVEVTKGVEIRGDPGATLDGEGGLGRAIGVSAPGAVLSNLTVRNYANEGIQAFADDLRVEGVTVEGTTYGLYAESTTGLRIRDVTVRDTQWMGVDLFGVADVEVTGLTATDNAQYGLSLGDCSGVRVENAALQGNAIGVLLQGTTDATLTGVEASDNRIGGLQAIDTTGITVSDARVTATPDGAGLFLAGVTDATFRNVTATDNGWGGTLLSGSGVTIEDCTVNGNDYGLDVVDATDVRVTRSSIRENGDGVYVSRQGDPASVTVQSNDIVGNDAFGLTLEPESESESSSASRSAVRDSELERLVGAARETLPALTDSLLANYDERRVAATPERTAAVLSAIGNWWGAAGGPGGEGPGDGDDVYGDVTYQPWSTAPGPDWNTDGGD